MKLKSILIFGLLTFSLNGFSKEVDPDLLPPLPDSPPKAASLKEVAKFQSELKNACIDQLKKASGLSSKVKIKSGNSAEKTCDCIAINVGKGRNLEELSILTDFYKGSDPIGAGSGSLDSTDMYIHEGTKLEENCKIKSNYKVGKPEPRLGE